MTTPPVNKVGSIKKWKLDDEELDWPHRDLNSIKHVWDQLESQLRARLYHPTSESNLQLVAERDQIPAARLKSLVESHPRRVEPVIAVF